MPKLSEDFYAVIVPQRAQSGSVRPETGTRPWTGFRVDRITRNRPVTKNSERAVRLTLNLDSSIFDILVPQVTIELGERDLFVNTRVEVNGEAIEDAEGNSENDSTS